MSVYQPRGTGVFAYDFVYKKRRYRGSTGQLTKEDALEAERLLKTEARRRAAGIAVPDPRRSPKIQEWAETYYDHVEKRVTRPEVQAHLIRAVLRFWGRRPADPDLVVAGAPYYDLTLATVAFDPSWLLKWEAWLDSRGLSAQTKNHYRSLMHQMFRLALHPAYRTTTGITTNPFAGAWRDPVRPRQVVISRDDLLAILRHASPHLRLAMAIALLTPKLRLGNILALRWKTNVAPDFSEIRVFEHKTVAKTKRPLVAYVPAQLRAILKAAKRRARGAARVVTYHRQPVKQLNGAVQGAVERAAAERGRRHLAYGRGRADGITFHTLRHTAATLLAEINVSPEKRQQLLGHGDLQTTMLYTHLPARHEADSSEQLSAALPELQAIVLARDASARDGGNAGDSAPKSGRRRRQKRASDTRVEARQS